jgi:hypothetical protein
MRNVKLIFIVICALFLHFAGRAQINLVLNPSFEQYAQCQPRNSNIKYANYWTPINDTIFSATDTLGPGWCSPEYCNTCVPYYCDVSIPWSTWYHHSPRTGNGMVRIITYYRSDLDSTSNGRRDYLQGRLKSRLTSGKQYSAFFYTGYTQNSAYANNNIGAYLDDGTIDTTTQCGMPQTTHTPQINDTSIYTDTLNWKKIEGTFTANGTERFITIGNFFDFAHTDTIYTKYWTWGGTWWGAYLIDDVGVIECDNIPHAGNDTAIRQGDTVFLGTHEQLLPYKWYVLGSSVAVDSGSGLSVHPSITTTYVLEQKLCGVTKYDTVTVKVWKVGVSPLSAEGRLLLYPNPSNGSLTIENAANCSVAFYDLTGRVVLRTTALTDKQAVDISALPKGIYVVQVVDVATGEKVVKRLCKE